MEFSSEIRMCVYDAQSLFLRKLYDLSKGKITPIARYDVGKELKLPNEETDAIVTELEGVGKIKKIGITFIMLTPEGIDEMK